MEDLPPPHVLEDVESGVGSLQEAGEDVTGSMVGDCVVIGSVVGDSVVIGTAVGEGVVTGCIFPLDDDLIAYTFDPCCALVTCAALVFLSVPREQLSA